MATPRAKVALTGVQETLLIPLYAKAMGSSWPNPIFADPKAEEILQSVEYDFSQLSIARKVVITMCIRAARFDTYAREFLASQPQAVVLHLGCGLDSRCLRVPHDDAQWYDLDLPEVIALRRIFYEETPTYHMIACSVTDPGWVDAVAASGRPVFAIAEGLLMYLKEAEVKALVLKLRKAFPGCHLACDVYSTLTVRQARRITPLQRTGAVVQWGIDDARTIETWAPGIRLREEWYFTQAEEIARLNPAYRLGIRIAGLFPAARKAERILYFTL